MAMASLAAHGEVEAQRVERLEARQPRAAKNQAVNVRKGQRDMCAMPAEQTMSRVCGAAGFSGRKHRRVRRGVRRLVAKLTRVCCGVQRRKTHAQWPSACRQRSSRRSWRLCLENLVIRR